MANYEPKEESDRGLSSFSVKLAIKKTVFFGNIVSHLFKMSFVIRVFRTATSYYIPRLSKKTHLS